LRFLTQGRRYLRRPTRSGWRRFNKGKAESFKARVQPENTLKDETGKKLQDITNPPDAWRRLYAVYAEDECAALVRCWKEFMELSYQDSKVKAPEFVRQYRLALLRLKLVKVNTNHRLQISNFVRAIGNPQFSDFFKQFEPGPERGRRY
jgi:hypothetical protein